MAIYKPKVTETTEDRLQKAINLSREEVLKEVLEWLDENFFTGEVVGYYYDVPDYIVQGKFDFKEEMIQTFKNNLILSNYGNIWSLDVCCRIVFTSYNFYYKLYIKYKI